MGEFPVNSLVLGQICIFGQNSTISRPNSKLPGYLHCSCLSGSFSIRQKAIWVEVFEWRILGKPSQNSGEENNLHQEISTDISNHSKLIQQTAARVHRSLRG
jgi:hypothetical protein